MLTIQKLQKEKKEYENRIKEINYFINKIKNINYSKSVLAVCKKEKLKCEKNIIKIKKNIIEIENQEAIQEILENNMENILNYLPL